MLLQILRFNDIIIFIIYLNISMILNKISIWWFWVDVTTKAQKREEWMGGDEINGSKMK